MKKILASLLGSATEWYDYTLYSCLINIIGKLFFPNAANDPYLSNIMAFGVFASGFLVRPFGGFLFGYIADRYSRKSAMKIAILIVSLPTVLIGLLPTYQTVGIIAPILLTLMRLLQGISLGGEFASTTSYLYETTEKNGKRCFMLSYSLLGLAIGIFLGFSTSLILETTLTSDQIMSYGWRIPFLCAFLIGLFGFYLRNKLEDVKIDEKAAKKLYKKNHSVFGDIFINFKTNLFVGIATYINLTVTFYTVCVFLKTAMITTLNYPVNIATKFSMIVNFSYMISIMFIGYCNDIFGPRKMAIFSSITVATLIYPLIRLIELQQHSMLCFIALGLLVSLSQGSVPIILASLFPKEVRSSGIAYSQNIPVLLGGCMPVICSFLIKNTGSLVSISFCIILSSICALIGALFYTKKRIFD